MDKRLQIDFSERAYNDLNALQRRLDAPSKSEVIRSALGVLKWLSEEIAANNRIVVERADGTEREIFFHFLDHLKKEDASRQAT